MTVVHDAIAEELAKLVPVTRTPVAPFGYGSDLRCSSDLTEKMLEVDGFSTLALAEALVRRLDTPRGSLPDDKTYGISLTEYCNRGTAAAELRDLASRIRGELQKDDRVAAVGVTITPASDGSSLAVQLAVTPVDPALGPFSLTLSVSSAEILIEEIGGGT